MTVRAYQLTLSPWIGGSCRFRPSCSAYAIEALQKHGFWHGGALTVWRLLRCQPFCRGGFDPVPEVRAKSNRRKPQTGKNEK